MQTLCSYSTSHMVLLDTRVQRYSELSLVGIFTVGILECILRMLLLWQIKYFKWHFKAVLKGFFIKKKTATEFFAYFYILKFVINYGIWKVKFVFTPRLFWGFTDLSSEQCVPHSLLSSRKCSLAIFYNTRWSQGQLTVPSLLVDYMEKTKLQLCQNY